MGLFGVIGLGRFGSTVARVLFEKGQEVIAVDSGREAVEDARAFSQQAVQADVRDREVLESLGLKDVDAAVVSLGQGLDASILVTLYLRELGVGKILVKAVTEDHAKILEKVGATEVILPEKQMGRRVAERLAFPNVLDQVTFGEGYSVMEIKAPEKLWGRSIEELEIRRKYNVVVVVIRREGEKPNIAPLPTDVVREGDILVVIGEDSKLERFKNL
jgi:trk system potassium uptake protein TrkA